MKQKILAALLAAVLLLAAGCVNTAGNSAGGDTDGASGAATSDSPEAQTLKQRSRDYLQQFRAGDFESILKDATDDVKTSLTNDKLSEIWAGATQKLGDYEAVGSVEYAEENGLRSVAVTENYAEKGLRTIFTYNSDGKLSGLHLQEADKIAVSSEVSSAPGPEEQALIQRSREYLEQFRAGQFDDFYKQVTDEVAKAAPRETFQAQWTAILQQAGKLESAGEPSVTEQNGQTIVQIPEIHLLRGLQCTFVYDSEGKVSGTNVQFTPLPVVPQSAEQWREVLVQVGAAAYPTKLPGLLTLPQNVENPPVVLLAPGSGPNDLDETIGAAGNKPFADLAHGLAEQGVASLRFDKRTYFAPLETVNKGVEAEYLDDVKAAVELLAQDGRVDANRIYLLGHSQGGMLGPKLCQDSPQVKGFISLAGSLRRMEDLSLEQNQKAADATDLTDAQKKAALATVREQAEAIKKLAPSDTTSVLLGLPAVYWNSLNAIDSAAIAKKLSIPMLILQGGADFQVNPDVDYPLWQSTLAGKNNVDARFYPELNHLFMTGGTKNVIDPSVYDQPAHMDARVITDIAWWIKGQTETAPAFLDTAQQELYREASRLYGCFLSSPDDIDTLYPPPSGGRKDPKSIRVNGVRYYEAQGQLRRWKDFMDKMLSVFTQEWFDQANGGDADAFIQRDGILYDIDADKSSSASYYGTSFSLADRSEKQIRFRITEHFHDYWQLSPFPADESNLQPDDDYTLTSPATMVLTDHGWRFSEFSETY